MPKKLSTLKNILTKELLIEEYLVNRLSAQKIADKHNIKTPTSVYKYIKIYKLEREDTPTSIPIILTKELLEEHYIRLEKDPFKIAMEFDVSYQTVTKSLKKHEIPLRKTQQSPKGTFKGFEGLSGYRFSCIRKTALTRKLDFNLDPEYLWNLFLKQDKKCAISGVEIELPPVGGGHKTRSGYTASVDRIDPTIGYLKGNVHWVHKRVNVLKWDFTFPDLKYWCYTIADYQRAKEVNL